MSQNITLLGASYTDVPSVLLPKTGGGTAQFDDTTDANATASDIASGKTAYVNGVKVIGIGGGSATLGTKTITQNGTYNASSDNLDGYSSVTVNTPTYKTGTVSFSTTYNTTGNRLICSLDDIGFTPSKFLFTVNDATVLSGIQYAVRQAEYQVYPTLGQMRLTTRYTNTSNTMGTSASATAWDTASSGYLYMDGTNVYMRTTSAYILPATTYTWVAIR